MADTLSQSLNALVVVPDAFHVLCLFRCTLISTKTCSPGRFLCVSRTAHVHLQGEPFNPNPWPPSRDAVMSFIGEKAAFDVVAADYQAAVEFVRRSIAADGKIGALGLCWGAQICMKLAGAKHGTFASVASAHPSFITPEGLEAVRRPCTFLLLSSADSHPWCCTRPIARSCSSTPRFARLLSAILARSSLTSFCWVQDDPP